MPTIQIILSVFWGILSLVSFSIAIYAAVVWYKQRKDFKEKTKNV